MEQELIVREEAKLEPLKPAVVVDIATEQANVLMDIVKKRKLYMTYKGKNYLYAEAWETIGAFNRTHAVTEKVYPIERSGKVVGYEAVVKLYKDGQVVGGAIMSCGFDEFPCRGKEGEAKHKAAKSAAQTWATSKAYRLNYSYVAILAGFQPTPAEEMMDKEPEIEDTKPDKATPAQIRAIFAIAKEQGFETEEDVKTYLKDILKKEYNLTSSDQLTKAQASDMIKKMKGENNG